jgi:hypothetical protein
VARGPDAARPRYCSRIRPSAATMLNSAWNPASPEWVMRWAILSIYSAKPVAAGKANYTRGMRDVAGAGEHGRGIARNARSIIVAVLLAWMADTESSATNGCAGPVHSR